MEGGIVSFTEKELNYVVEEEFIEFLYENVWEENLETSYYDYKRIFLDDIFDLPSEVLNDDVKILRSYNKN